MKVIEIIIVFILLVACLQDEGFNIRVNGVNYHLKIEAVKEYQK